MLPRTTHFLRSHYRWLTFWLFVSLIGLLLLPLERLKSSAHAMDQDQASQSLSYQTFDTRQIAELSELYGKWQSGEQFAEEEKLILQRWGVGLPLSELEGRVVISRVLFERYVANKELSLEDEGLLSEFENYRRAAGRLIEDERVRVKQERYAQQQGSQSQSSPLLVAAIPANDNCSGAIGIPDTGSYPITTAIVDATMATTTGDPNFCATTDRTIWYTFVPAVTATYSITSCTAGTGSSSDTVVGVFTSTGSCAGPFISVACNDDDVNCSNESASTVSPILTAGVTYYIVAGRSASFSPIDPGPIQLAISRVPVPANDLCSGAQPLTLNTPVAATTAGANKNYQLSGTSCFTGIGQTPVVADGRDVVYSFTPQAAGNYSFRVTGLTNTNSDLVLYVTTSCPGPSTITCNNSSGPAIGAANRLFGTTAEEVMCVPLVGGQTYFLFVDEQQQSDGSAFTVEVNPCQREVEPNDLPGTAGTGTEGSIGSGTDVDFYQLGTPAAGSRVFALLDGVAANSSDFDMRVTTSTNTLEYDDKEADSQFGSLAPVIAGTPLTGVASFLRINHKSGTMASEPYRLYSQIQAAGAIPLAACPSITTSATAETEANNTAASADTLPNNCQLPRTCYYASGAIGSGDVDYFSFTATAGNLIFLAVDGNPCRDGVVSAFNPALELRDSADAQLIRVNDINSSLTCPDTPSVCTQQPGLTATAPNSAAEALVYRARTTGTYYATVSQGAASTGNYLLSISLGNDSVPTPTPTPTPSPSPGSSIVQFNTSTASATETANATTKLDLLVTRTGNTTQAATVNYATSNATANDRSDYETALGTLHFAAGETSKTIPVFIINDVFGESAETFNITLSNPVACTLGSPAAMVITINSDEAVNGLNPVRDPSFNSDFYVRQHYLDFFNRVPDQGGLDFWKNQIDECQTQECRDIRRINVSAAFFLSIEFQQTGYLVERLYKVAYGNALGTSTLDGAHTLPVPIVRFNEFLADTQQIGRGVVIGQPGADQLLESNKQALIAEFVQRSRFITALPLSLTPTQFVDKLNENAGGVLSPTERTQLIADLTNSTKSRAQVLRAVAEDPDLEAAESNRAFVLVQYFGYLRRNPNDPQDTDYTGYDFWLRKLNEFNGNFVNAEMVKAFILSGEYQGRFGP